jgi:hypothetical protein
MPPFTSESLFSLPRLSLPRFSLPRFSLPWTKRRDTMDANPWTVLLERTFKESTTVTLILYTTAAEKADDPDSLLNRLDVVWIWQLKVGNPPYHEFFAIETVDPENNQVQVLILERVLLDGNCIEVTEVRYECLGIILIILIVVFRPIP